MFMFLKFNIFHLAFAYYSLSSILVANLAEIDYLIIRKSDSEGIFFLNLNRNSYVSFVVDTG